MDSSILCLTWNDHIKNISDVFMEQLTNENLVDVTIKCEGKFIKAHKMVLSAGSPYLHEMLSMDNTPDPVIIMNNVKYSDLKCVIDFMYCGQITVSVEDFKSVVSLAQSLKIKGLFDEENAADIKNLTANPPGEPGTLPSKKKGAHRKKKTTLEEKGTVSNDGMAAESSMIENIKKEPIETDEIGTVEDLSICNYFEGLEHWQEKSKAKSDKVCFKINSNNTAAEEPAITETVPSTRQGNDIHIKLPNNISCSTHIKELSSSYLDNIFKSRQSNDGERIRRPPNAFMIFSGEWRKKLSKVYPTETSSGLCRRLGEIWNSLQQKDKQFYFEAARLACQEHKEKYPGYHYCPQKRKRSQILAERQAKMPKLKFTKVYLTGVNNLSVPVLIALNNPEMPLYGDQLKKRARRNSRQDNSNNQDY